MPLSIGLTATAAVQAAADAMAAAQAAMAQANNARQMVLTRDPAAATVATDIAALSAAMDALTALVNALPTIRTGSASVSASLLGGATRDVVVTLNATMGTATYSAGAWINGGTSLLGQTQLVGITAQTANSVTVQIKNTGLTSIAAAALSVQVLAVK